MSRFYSSSHQKARPYTELRTHAATATTTASPNPSLGPNGRPVIQGIELVASSQLPDQLKPIFPYPLFNAIQSKCFDAIYSTDDNFVLSAPTGSGKTGVLELAICRLVVTHAQQGFKVIYQAPTKSLCAERYRDWQAKFRLLGLNCAELTGDTDKDQLRLVGSADIIITTPEKWDGVTRKWRDHHRLVDLVKLFLIDEVQILKEDRGASLEAVVSRMKSVGNEDVRFIALSATVPNAHDVAKWLGRNGRNRCIPAIVETFNESFRPVELDKHVYGLPSNGPNDFAFEKVCSNRLPDVITKYSVRMKPIMVFCFTRKSTEITAQLLANWWQSQRSNERFWSSPSEIAPVTVTDENLQKYINAGVAYHHAGVDLHDRTLIERAYLEGKLSVICCTSTLAVGMNLPCYCVIIKNTVRYQPAEGCKEYSDLEIMQMLGRAGRPQFGNSAVAVIMTRQEKMQRYKRMVAGHEILESRLHHNLIEHLNAEIGLGTIFDTLSAKVWLRSTFFYIRYKENPNHYQLQVSHDKTSSGNVDDIIQLVSDRDIGLLKENNLVTPGLGTDTFRCTEYGNAMARYCIQFETMKVFLSLPAKANIFDIIAAISQASEFKSVRFRAGEKQMFKEINRSSSIKFPITSDLTLPTHKVSLIIQATLGGIDVTKDERFTGNLQQYRTDMSLIFNHVHRFIRCIIDCQLSDQDATGARNALEVSRSVAAKAWDDTSLQMMQIENIGPVAVRKLVNVGVRTIEELAELDSQRIDMILSKNPPFGVTLLDKLKSFPKLRVALQKIGQPSIKVVDSDRVIRVHIKVEFGFLNDTAPTMFMKKAVHVCLLAETSDGRKINFCRIRYDSDQTLTIFTHNNSLISGQKLGRGQEVEFTADIVSPDQTVSCYVACDEIAGTLKYATLELGIPIAMFYRIGGVQREPQPLLKAKRLQEEIRKTGGQGTCRPDTEVIVGDLDEEDVSIAAIAAEASNGVDIDENEDGFIDIDYVTERDDPAGSRDVHTRRTLAGTGRPRLGFTAINSSSIVELANRNKDELHNRGSAENTKQSWEPRRLINGNWECNHCCKDKAKCKHRCCQDGVDKPPKRPKTLKDNGDVDREIQSVKTTPSSVISDTATKRVISKHWSIVKPNTGQYPQSSTCNSIKSLVPRPSASTVSKSNAAAAAADDDIESNVFGGSEDFEDLTDPPNVETSTLEKISSLSGTNQYGDCSNVLNPYKFKVPELDLSGNDPSRSSTASKQTARMLCNSRVGSHTSLARTNEFRNALQVFEHVEEGQAKRQVDAPLGQSIPQKRRGSGSRYPDTDRESSIYFNEYYKALRQKSCVQVEEITKRRLREDPCSSSKIRSQEQISTSSGVPSRYWLEEDQMFSKTLTPESEDLGTSYNLSRPYETEQERQVTSIVSPGFESDDLDDILSSGRTNGISPDALAIRAHQRANKLVTVDQSDTTPKENALESLNTLIGKADSYEDLNAEIDAWLDSAAGKSE